MLLVPRSAVLLLCMCALLSAQETLKISVYYETLCPDSVGFVENQLKPTYNKLGKYLTLDFIPYGKAIQNQNDGKWFFECQHGQLECFGNKIQSCMLNEKFNQTTNLNYISCFMKNYNPKVDGEKCAKEFGMDWEPIRACANSNQGSELLAQNGDRTHALQPKISFIPTIYFNDAYNSTLHYRSLSNLFKVACKLLNMPEPCTA